MMVQHAMHDTAVRVLFFFIALLTPSFLGGPRYQVFTPSPIYAIYLYLRSGSALPQFADFRRVLLTHALALFGTRFKA